MFFPRYYTFETEGRTLGCASTLFVLMDLDERKIAPVSRLGEAMPEYDIPAPLPSPAICARWTARSRAMNTCPSTPIWI